MRDGRRFMLMQLKIEYDFLLKQVRISERANERQTDCMMHAAQTPAGDELQFALTRRTLAAANNLRAFAASSLEQIDTQSNRAAKLVCFFNPPPQMHSTNSHKLPCRRVNQKIALKIRRICLRRRRGVSVHGADIQ
jgi:hypothetical protein